MVAFEVWHRDTPDFLDNSDAVLASFPTGFTHVATVTTGEVGQVFQLTNHIDSNWTENDGVTSHVGLQVRSTSVGDVIVESRWVRWSVQMLGLRKF